MFKRTYRIDLKPGQRLRLVAVGDVHFDTEECDRERVKRFCRWVQERERAGEKVRLVGPGDYLDFGSPTERLKLMGTFHETTNVTLDMAHLANLHEFLCLLKPIKHCFVGLLTGHHHYLFATRKAANDWQGRSSDAWLSHQLGCDYWGNGIALIRFSFRHDCSAVVTAVNRVLKTLGVLLTPDECPHPLHLDSLVWHGAGGAQTPGGRVQKRMRVAEIAPMVHLVFVGHDNAKLAYPRSGLDYRGGYLKRYVIGTGSFQRAYLQGEEAGYAERMGLIPADLGVTVVDVGIERRDGRWRVDYHASV